MKDRIKKYMDYKSITAGELASLLEVQRSNISHILNGRNMPGAAFIEKFLLSFPDLNARWLLTGVGEMITNLDKIVEKAIQKPVEIEKPVIQEKAAGEKHIGKVVLLFEDGTFMDYTKK